jgi:hypothetical protein
MQDQVVPSMTSPNSENASAIFFSVLEKDKPAAKLLVQANRNSMQRWHMAMTQLLYLIEAWL